MSGFWNFEYLFQFSIELWIMSFGPESDEHLRSMNKTLSLYKIFVENCLVCTSYRRFNFEPNIEFLPW